MSNCFEQEVGITATYNFYADPRSSSQALAVGPQLLIKELLRAS